MAYVAIAMMALSAVQQYRAGQKAEALAEENARRIQAETEEQARRFEKQAQLKEGQARARAAASGAGGSASIQNYLGEMSEEFGQELDWLKTAGAGRAAAARAGGQQARAQATAGAVGSLGQMFGYGYGADVFSKWGINRGGTGT